ncbi:hypothetical protein MRX96_007215 [Rhipicephalus microplus]
MPAANRGRQRASITAVPRKSCWARPGIIEADEITRKAADEMLSLAASHCRVGFVESLQSTKEAEVAIIELPAAAISAHGDLPAVGDVGLPCSGSSSEKLDAKDDPEKTESLCLTCAQVFVPFLLAGMGSVAASLLLDHVKGISQRGHDESARSENKGNFVELLNSFAKYDDIIGKKLNGGAANAKYVHHSIQDQILEILSHITLTSIKEEMKSSQCFALIVDETKYLSKMEQLSVVVRYYLNGAVFERFLGFRNAEQLDAKSLLSYVKETLNRCGIDSQLCIAQTYDGASVMSGTSRGVQALFRQEVPQAVYVHCMNHRRNLVIVDVCKAIKPNLGL